MACTYRYHIFCLFSTLGCNTVMFILQYGLEINSQFTCLGKVVNIDSTTAKQIIHCWVQQQRRVYWLTPGTTAAVIRLHRLADLLTHITERERERERVRACGGGGCTLTDWHKVWTCKRQEYKRYTAWKWHHAPRYQHFRRISRWLRVTLKRARKSKLQLSTCDVTQMILIRISSKFKVSLLARTTCS
jgi:hypothetical protein